MAVTSLAGRNAGANAHAVVWGDKWKRLAGLGRKTDRGGRVSKVSEPGGVEREDRQCAYESYEFASSGSSAEAGRDASPRRKGRYAEDKMILRNLPCSLSTCPLALTFSLSQVSLSAGLSKLRSLSTRLGLEPARHDDNCGFDPTQDSAADSDLDSTDSLNQTELDSAPRPAPGSILPLPRYETGGGGSGSRVVLMAVVTDIAPLIQSIRMWERKRRKLLGSSPVYGVAASRSGHRGARLATMHTS